MALRHDAYPSVTRSGPEVEGALLMPFCALLEDTGGTLTDRFDLYLAIIVPAMFLAGCVLVILNGRERSLARKRRDG